MLSIPEGKSSFILLLWLGSLFHFRLDRLLEVGIYCQVLRRLLRSLWSFLVVQTWWRVGVELSRLIRFSTGLVNALTVWSSWNVGRAPRVICTVPPKVAAVERAWVRALGLLPFVVGLEFLGRRRGVVALALALHFFALGQLAVLLQPLVTDR